MDREIFNSNTFLLLANAEVGKHFYWNIAGFLVHGQVLIVIWFVLLILLVLSFLGTKNADRIPHRWQNFMEAVKVFQKHHLIENNYKIISNGFFIDTDQLTIKYTLNIGDDHVDINLC